MVLFPVKIVVVITPNLCPLANMYYYFQELLSDLERQ
jgi:hypothetical protein